MPIAVENLLVIAVLKSYASKFSVKKISVAKGVGRLEFPSLESFGDERILAALDKYAGTTRLNMSAAPVVEFFGSRKSVDLMAEMTKFLKFALTFTRI
jgi:transcription-repair coupling factor (superfamily II helicase)